MGIKRRKGTKQIGKKPLLIKGLIIQIGGAGGHRLF